MKWDEEYLKETLKTLDNDQILSIMAIGEESISKLKLQKIIFLASKILKVDISDNFEAYDYGMFDEALMEEVEDMPEIINKKKNLSLTDFGIAIYNKLLELLDKRIIELFQILRSLDEDKLLEITYNLYPEYTENSKIKDKVIKEPSKIEVYNMLKFNQSLININKKSKYIIKKLDDSIEITKAE